MKAKRSSLPLPRYVLRKPLKSGAWAYYFTPPMWARRDGCLLQAEALGTDYNEAVKRAETVLLPAFDSWLSGGASDDATTIVSKSGTLDWLFSVYRGDRRFTPLDTRTKRVHESGFGLVGRYVLKDGRRLGQMPVSAISAAIVDLVYEKLLVVTETVDGNEIQRERRTTINHAMKSCRRAWNVAARCHPGKVPHVNPFAAMGLKSVRRKTPTATYEELQAFRAKAVAMGYPSLATAALITWEFLQRERDVFCTLEVTHYRPKERPNVVRVLHHKTGEESWVPLFDDNGAPLYPELMGELDAIKRARIGGLMLTRGWGDRSPWPTYPTPDNPDLTHMSRTVKKIIRDAGLRDELTFTSFRHGGFTEAGDAELTDREIMAQGRHRSPKMLKHYVKRSMRQVMEGTKKRRALREGESE
jgi:hypothetical protein